VHIADCFRIDGHSPGKIVLLPHGNASQGEVLTATSFLIQSERVDVLASNIAEQQRRVCRIQTHIPSKPPGIVPILQIDDLLRFAATGADSKQSYVAADAPEINELAIR